MAILYHFLSGEDPTRRFFPKLRLAWPFPSRARQSPTASIASLQTSLNPADTMRSLRAHHWSAWDTQYVFLAILGLFSLCVIQSPGSFSKTLIATVTLLSLLIPLTRQVVLPALPIVSWLVLLYACKYIPGDYRPPIWVRVLPALENILYGANLSNILSVHKSTALDTLAWLPYGVMHFGAPVVCSAVIFIFSAPSTTPAFARAFGYMNIVGVITQLFFACSPPWYENLYGIAPANYSMPGSPAGLAAIDKLLGIDLYTSTFTASPMVFGAFPPLHSGCATIEALFIAHTFPKLRPLFVVYVLWLWWAAMYFSHHYAVDLVAGSIIAYITYFVARSQVLPIQQHEKMFRWEYDHVEYGEPVAPYAYNLAGERDLQDRRTLLGYTDELILGSSSRTGTVSRSSSTGWRGRVSADETWERSTLGSTSDIEYQKDG